MSDEELKRIADKAVNDWLDTRELVDDVTGKDLLAILIGTTIGAGLSYLISNSKLKRRINALEEKINNM